MPKHPDAVGYLNDLAVDINEPWFKMVCELAAVSGTAVPDQFTLDTLFALYTNKASYLGIKSAVSPAAAAPAASMDFLEQLAGFANFKLLGNTLEVGFNKRITLIFGANGSGKSSLCESLKVLATPEPPNRPLQNLRATNAATPSFLYKFKSDVALQTWTPVVGYGPRQTTVKYFDAAIAARNVKNAVEPGRVIVLTPFRLHVFQWAKDLTTKLREALQRAQLDNSVKLTQALEVVRTDFAKFKGLPLSAIDDKGVAVLPAQIKLGEGFADQKLLSEKQTAIVELEKAASEEGLKLLRAEHRELETFLTTLSTLVDSAAGLWALEPANKAKTLAEKQAAQEVLAEALIPKDGTLDGLLALIRTASSMWNMEDAAGHACPLCKRELGVPEVDLFKQYHELLAGELEKDILALKGDLVKAGEFVTTVAEVDRAAWDKYTTIPVELMTAAKVGADQVVDNCEASKEPTVEAKTALDVLISLSATWATQLESKKKAIEVAAKGREELLKQLAKLRGETEPLEYAHAIAERMEKLRETQGMVNYSTFWSTRLPAFAHVLKRITEKAKEAHEELVVLDFEARLDTEYNALAEKNMAAFGVILARKGAEATVTVLPQIGGRDIEGVLSEGEQRIHALALFFAELEPCLQSVLVFDNPVSSFDYNYIANYCARLRDFTLKHPAKQIIVLTHNWEFFAQLQTTLNVAGLDPHLSVHVLESCAVVSEYSEKIDDLKKDIEAILASPGEPFKTKKEETAGKMRRLIEAVVNTHVFNNQRHQYKQKSQAITAFPSFTKVVALLPAEATTLRDLYAKLSITEHDDPRAAYVITDKAMFQTRYDHILAVETAIIARTP
jgi:DNA repair exonuclease SbcCD ATPase subunit